VINKIVSCGCSWMYGYLSKIFQPIKNQVDRFSNWWRDLFKEEMIKDIRG